jgi:hypothetical protein
MTNWHQLLADMTRDDAIDHLSDLLAAQSGQIKQQFETMKAMRDENERLLAKDCSTERPDRIPPLAT